MADEPGTDSSVLVKYSIAWYENWVNSDMSWYDQTILDKQACEREEECLRKLRGVTEPSVEVRIALSRDRLRHRRSKKSKKVHTKRHITINELYSAAPKLRRPSTSPRREISLNYDCDPRRGKRNLQILLVTYLLICLIIYTTYLLFVYG